MLYVETLKTDQARTVPLLSQVVPIIDRWCEGKEPGDWIFDAPNGGMLSEANWKRSVRWSETIKAFGKPDLTVHDCATRLRPSGWRMARTRRSCSASSAMPLPR